MTDKEFLSWVHDRLHYQHHEDPKIDYMIRLRKIINEIDGPIDNSHYPKAKSVIKK